jgi:hypothetical protein
LPLHPSAVAPRRKDSNGNWSQKVGEAPVTDTDRAGNKISDPETVARDGGYDKFCGYFTVDPATIQIGTEPVPDGVALGLARWRNASITYTQEDTYVPEVDGVDYYAQMEKAYAAQRGGSQQQGGPQQQQQQQQPAVNAMAGPRQQQQGSKDVAAVPKGGSPKATPKPAPAKQQPERPKPAPAKEQPKPAPAKEQPKPAPAKEQPKPAPAKEQPKPAASKPASDPAAQKQQPQQLARPLLRGQQQEQQQQQQQQAPAEHQQQHTPTPAPSDHNERGAVPFGRQQLPVGPGAQQQEQEQHTGTPFGVQPQQQQAAALPGQPLAAFRTPMGILSGQLARRAETGALSGQLALNSQLGALRTQFGGAGAQSLGGRKLLMRGL